MSSSISLSNREVWSIRRGQDNDILPKKCNFCDTSKHSHQPFYLYISIEVKALTLLPGNQSPKSLYDLLKELSGSRCIEHNLVIPPKYLHQPSNKDWWPVITFEFVKDLWMITLLVPVKRDVTQVACSLFMLPFIRALSLLDSIDGLESPLGLQLWLHWPFSFQAFWSISFSTLRSSIQRPEHERRCEWNSSPANGVGLFLYGIGRI